VTEEEFLKAATDAIRTSGRRVEELSRTGQPPDHPATFKEARYLKCVFYREMKI
jgi:23S rRNA (cytosine1962-C5)-methyltransferase